jgi:cytochrome c oxidase subunit IV
MAPHIVSRQVYYRVCVTLLAFTLLTVGIAFLDLGGDLNTVVAMSIAVCKALLVGLFFMHLRYSSRLTWLCVGAGLFWLVLLLSLTMSDYLTRNWLPVTGW